jgi:hypothetical protein
MNLSEVLLPLSRISLLGRMMSDRMTFSRPNCFLISLASPLPSWPSPPVSNDPYIQSDSLHRDIYIIKVLLRQNINLTLLHNGFTRIS